MIDKGYVSAVLEGGNKVTVVPACSGDVVTQPLVVPFFLLGTMKPKKEIVFCSFSDGSGIVLANLDGTWSQKLDGDISIAGKLSVSDLEASGAVSANGVNLGDHTHTDSNGETTSGPGGSTTAVLGVAKLGSMILGKR